LTKIKKPKKLRLDQLLVQRELAESTDVASRLIMAGLVYVGGHKSDKPGMPFREDADVELREVLPYVSRGGLKLAGALDYFPFDVAGGVALDVGASTGGFTDVLLQRGAIRVYAVDVGHGQLHYKLQHDERVINLEKTHVRLLSAEVVPEPVDMLVMDTSFISLRKVLPPSWPFLRPGGWCVALIKPQFEVEPRYLDKGVVRDESLRQQVVEDMISFVSKELEGVHVAGVTESPIHGPKGNVEYLLGMTREDS
jgi:23S rRNA (cytidine1920-2'-O)/16S rRNA (cytidine1409-2'-O)-methyltransferase